MKKIFQNFPVEIQGGFWQFHFCRSLIAIALMTLLMVLTGQKFIINNLISVIIRSILYTFSMLIYFGCLSFLPIAIVGAGMFTAPIFVLIFSYFLFKHLFAKPTFPWERYFLIKEEETTLKFFLSGLGLIIL